MTNEQERQEFEVGNSGSGATARIELGLGLGRRAVLAGAVGGFALAAGGLFVPRWLQEVDAREGAYGGRLGGRHGRNRRGRSPSQRRDNNKNENDGPRGSSGSQDGPHVRWIKFNLYNDLAIPNQSSVIEPWVRLEGSQWGKFPNSSLANGKAAAFPFRSAYQAALHIDSQFYVEGRNFAIGTPQVVLAHGGRMTETGYEAAQGSTLVKSLVEGEEWVRFVAGRRFAIKRITDSKDYIEFDVHYS
jgi:hypothetical protein